MLESCNDCSCTGLARLRRTNMSMRMCTRWTILFVCFHRSMTNGMNSHKKLG